MDVVELYYLIQLKRIAEACVAGPREYHSPTLLENFIEDRLHWLPRSERFETFAPDEQLGSVEAHPAKEGQRKEVMKWMPTTPSRPFFMRWLVRYDWLFEMLHDVYMMFHQVMRM